MRKRSDPLATSDREDIRDLVGRVNSTEDIEEILELTKSPYPEVRVAAVRQICPCKVFDTIPEFWERILEMTDDVDTAVRFAVLHVLCDGSPDYLEDRIITAVESFNRDPDKEIRRRAHKVLGSYRSSGKWNVL
jgi:HEAT repeat protein